MSELATDIANEVREFLNRDREDIQRVISRTAIMHLINADVTVNQRKFLGVDEAKLARAVGPKEFATTQWFNDFEWMQSFEQSPEFPFPFSSLGLDITYPIESLKGKPSGGMYSDGDWFQQYGCIGGYGSGEIIDSWMTRIVDPETGKITVLKYPEDPTAIEQYNEYYKQYLDFLDSINPTMDYRQAWDHHFSYDSDKPSLVLGGMALSGFAVKEVFEPGIEADNEQFDYVDMLFIFQEKLQNGHHLLDLAIYGDGRAEATDILTDDDTETTKEASEELMQTALKLVQATNKL